jgi:hypothetical protein
MFVVLKKSVIFAYPIINETTSKSNWVFFQAIKKPYLQWIRFFL